MENKIIFNTDTDAATIFVMKVLPGTVTELWKYFADPRLLELWWAPKPWICRILKMDLNDGGQAHYQMTGPDGEQSYGGINYEEVREHRSISFSDYFSDAEGNVQSGLPVVNWLVGFTGVEEGTKLTVNIHFKNSQDLQMLLDMDFEGGFTTALKQLEELVAV